MLKEFLEEVVVLVAGKPAEPIADLLDSKKHVNEFNIAKKLDLTINQTRNILYKISDYGLVSSIRKKDKKKGWYTYFWKIEVLKALEFLRESVFKRLQQFENQISSRETKTFYLCQRCSLEFTEENALHLEFACPECGDVLSLKDNSKLLKEMKRNLDKLNEKIGLLDKEIEKETERLGKAKEKERKKREKEAAEKRAAKRAARKAATKKKIVNSDEKKVDKKKVVKKSTKSKISSSKTKSKVSSAKDTGRKKKPVKKKVTKKKTIKKKSKK